MLYRELLVIVDQDKCRLLSLLQRSPERALNVALGARTTAQSRRTVQGAVMGRPDRHRPSQAICGPYGRTS